MATAEQIAEIFDADIEVPNIYGFRSFIKKGFPTSWARSFLNRSNLGQAVDDVFPNLSRQTSSASGLTETQPEVLSLDESQLLFDLARVYLDAVEFFGSADLAKQWLVTPNLALGQEVPLHSLAEPIGFESVSSELLRLSYGIVG